MKKVQTNYILSNLLLVFVIISEVVSLLYVCYYRMCTSFCMFVFYCISRSFFIIVIILIISVDIEFGKYDLENALIMEDLTNIEILIPFVCVVAVTWNIELSKAVIWSRNTGIKNPISNIYIS
uniref:Uncharacterized protein n=1 Tax=Cacopsylla melanoneura TaxID=428564 RepID=A0A8D9EVX5_9HEMI